MNKQKVVIKAIYEVEKSSARAMEQSAKKVQQSLSDAVSSGVKTQISDYTKQFEKLANRMESMDGNMSSKEFKEINSVLQKVNKNYDQFLKDMNKGVDIQVDTKALDELEAKITASSDKLEKLRKQNANTQRLNSKEGMDSVRREMVQDSLDGREAFAGFDGTGGSLGIKGITKTAARFDVLERQARVLQERLVELRAVKRKLTESESKEILSLEEDESKVNTLLKIFDAIKEATNAEALTRKDRIQQLKDEQVEYDKLIKQQEELLKLDQSKQGKAVAESRQKSGQVGEDLKSSAIDQRVNEVATEDLKKFADNDGAKSPGIGQQGLETMLQQYFSVNAALRMVQNMVRKTIDTISDLDAAFVSIAVVTQYTNKEVWSMYGAFNSIASAAGFTVAEIGKVASEYFRQGESYSNVIMLTEAAAKAAQVAGIDAGDSVKYLTSAVKGYNLEASDAMMISDKFAAVAANSATSYEGLATAMSKVAAQASANNVEMDSLMGMMATSMEVTQEAPENIGTAFKTILARMSEIKDYGKVLEDGMDANRIEKALKTVNVELFDQQNEMRNLDTVLLEVGDRWDTLNRSQKAYLATSLAGTRQQTRLLAVLENMDMTRKNIETSRDSEGATEAQQLKNTESIAFNLNRINVAYESITKNLANSAMVIGIVKGLAASVEALATFSETAVGKVTALGVAIMTTVKAMQLMVQTDMAKSLGRYILNVTNATVKTRILTTATKMSGVATGNTAIAMGLLQSAMKFLSIGTAVVGVLALVYSIAKVSTGSAIAARKLKKIKEATDEIKAATYNLKQEKKTLTDLTDEYTKLDGKVLKTSEDMERQAEIMQLLKDSDMEGNYRYSNSDGSLNQEEVDRHAADIAEQEAEKFREAHEEGLKLVDIYDKITDSNEQYQANQALAIENMAEGSYETWSELDSEIQAMAIEWERLAHGLRVMRYADGKVYSGETKTVSTGEGNSYQTDMEDNIVHESDADGPSPESIQQWVAYKKTVDETTMTTDEYTRAVESMEGAEFIAQEGKSVMAKEFSNLGAITLVEMKKLGNFFEQTKENGVELSDSMQKSLARAFASDNTEGFFNMLQNEYANAEDSAYSFGDALRQTIDMFDEVPEDVMLDNLVTFDSFADSLTTLNDELDNFNAKSLDGAFKLLEQYSEFPDILDDITESIISTGTISEEVQADLLAQHTANTRDMINDEIAQNETRIAIAKAEKEMLEKAAIDKDKLRTLAGDRELKVSELTAEGIVNNMVKLEGENAKMLKGMVAAAGEAGILYQKNFTEGSNYDFSATSAALDKDFSQKGVTAKMSAMSDLLSAQAKSVGESISVLENKNKLLSLSLDKIGDSTWNTSTKEREKAAKKAAKQAKENTKEAKEYLGVLNKLYIAQKKLELVKWGSDLLTAQQAYLETADSVESLAGSQNRLKDVGLAEVMQDQHGVLQQEKEVLEDLSRVTKSYQDDLENGLSKSLKGTYKVYKGQIIPVSAQYKKLTYEQMKELDEFAKSFNDLGKEVNGYTTEILNAEKAQNDLIAQMRDKVIEYQEVVIDAIKNEEKKQIESFKKIIDANKKYLEQRKKLYEEAFSEEDKDKESEDIEKQRQDVIEKLAALESAHDITSIQRKEQYRKELESLNEQYNLLQLTRNREAMLESLDRQAEYQENIYQREEEAYNARIESSEWLEERLKQVQDDARIQAILDLTGHTQTIQSMIDNGYITRQHAEEIGMIDINTSVNKLLADGHITQEQLSRLGVEKTNKTVKQLMDEGVITQRDLTRVGIVTQNTMVNDLNGKQLAVFKKYWSNNRDVIDKMWNGAEGQVGAVALSEAAMNNILNYLTRHSTSMEGKTKLMKDKVVGEWGSMIRQVAAYTKNFNATTLQGPKYGAVTNANKNMLANIKSTVDQAANHYRRLVTEANKAMAASNSAPASSGGSNSGGANPKPVVRERTVYYYKGRKFMVHDQAKGERQNDVGYLQTAYKKADGRKHQNQYYYDQFIEAKKALDAAEAYKITSKVEKYKTGGTTARTGLHWLDGKPGAPERVLSPGANKNFEELLGSLTSEADNRQDNKDIVDSLMNVVKAVYDSGQESAEAITKAIDGISVDGGGASIKAIARSHGLSLNKRGDR